jgi:hypothetical protein
MAHIGRVLDAGELFPGIEFNITSGGKIHLPADFGETWNVFFIYRGQW